MGDEQTPPKVFVSYSWDSDEHTDWVLSLATRLRSDGVDVVLDRWDTQLGSVSRCSEDRTSGSVNLARSGTAEEAAQSRARGAPPPRATSGR